MNFNRVVIQDQFRCCRQKGSGEERVVVDSSHRLSPGNIQTKAPKWVEWAEQVDLSMSNLTGPEAPHYFRVTRRRCLGADSPCGSSTEEVSRVDEDLRGYNRSSEDVVMVVKALMASVEVSQVILMVPAARLPRLHALPTQPSGTHQRRLASDDDRKRVHDMALNVHASGVISRKACDYLTQWARGTRRRLPRPAAYNFLNHRVDSSSNGDRAANPYVPEDSGPQRPVHVAAIGHGAPLPPGRDSDDEGQLAISEP